MSSHIPAILQFVGSQPWAIEEGKLEAIRELLSLRSNNVRFTVDEIHARIGTPPERPAVASTVDGVAVIPIYGVIAQRAPMLRDVSDGGGTSTERVGRALDAALADPNVKSILLDVDSPGGTISGVPELAAKVRATGQKKPVVAIANTFAASAAYWIASAAAEVIASPSALVGSIGVYTIHTDLSKALATAGIKPSVIKAGKFKAETNEFGPLSDEARAALQQQVDESYALFVHDVALGRGVATQAVRSGYGQGRAVMAKQARSLGLVDRVATFEETVRRLATPGTAARLMTDRRAKQLAHERAEIASDGGYTSFRPLPTSSPRQRALAEKARLDRLFPEY